jgi:hypothetical protein
MTTTFRIERWTDDDGRSGGGCQYTVIEIAADGTETDVLTTHDEDEAREFVSDRGGVIVEDV